MAGSSLRTLWTRASRQQGHTGQSPHGRTGLGCSRDSKQPMQLEQRKRETEEMRSEKEPTIDCELLVDNNRLIYFCDPSTQYSTWHRTGPLNVNWKDRQVDNWLSRWIDGWMDGRTDGRMERETGRTDQIRGEIQKWTEGKKTG